MPFNECTDFEMIELFQSSRKKIMMLIKEKSFEHLTGNLGNFLNTNENKIEKCKYYDEEEVNKLIPIDKKQTLKIYAFNIRSLSKNAGRLHAFLSNLPELDILVLTEIGIWNIDIAANCFSNYNYNLTLPEKNSFGGVAIFVNNINITSISFKEYPVNMT